MDLTEKKCPECATVKAVEDYGRNAALGDGLAFYCKACCRQKARDHYRAKRAALGKSVRDRIPAPQGQKWCPDCKCYQPRAAFALNRASYDGLNSYCKVHHNLRAKDWHLERTYGLTANKVRALSDRQADVCAICLRPLGERTHVDHDHATGELRGLLCFNCNGGLGQFRDDPWVLRRAHAYLVGDLVAPVKIAPGLYDVSSRYRRPGT